MDSEAYFFQFSSFMLQSAIDILAESMNEYPLSYRNSEAVEV